MNKILISFLVIMSLFLSSCGQKDKANEKREVTIAYQYGLAYAPFEIMKNQKLIEKKLNGFKVNWIVMSSGGAINEGILSGDIDIAVMGTAPFLIGNDKGVPYKIFSSVASQTLSLITYDPSIESLSDFKPGDKIALPAVGSIQHLVLAMGAKDQLNDAHILDSMIVNMSSPDAFQAVKSGKEVKAHLVGPPYSNLSLKEPGHHAILNSTSYLGKDASSIIAVTTDKLEKDFPKVLDAVENSLEEAIGQLNHPTDEVLTQIAQKEGISKEELSGYLTDGSIEFRQEVSGVLELAEFMEETGYIKSVPKDSSEIQFE